MHLLIKLAGGVPWGGPLWGKLQSGRVREGERDSHLSRCVGPDIKCSKLEIQCHKMECEA